jgi:hypothetical protein
MRDETLEWLNERPIEALQCRDLRHAWPRDQSRRGRKLESSQWINWRVIVTKSDGSPKELQREMACTGGCGVVRVEEFLVMHDGSLHRGGIPRYRYPKAFLRKRDPDAPLLEPINRDTLRGILVHRLYPNLAW